MKEQKYDPIITVCSKCFRACCWQGEFMCDDAVEASTVNKKVSELVNGNYGEHPDYWNHHLEDSGKKLLTLQDLNNLGIPDPEKLDIFGQ